MAHYSEMNFLFEPTNRQNISNELDNTSQDNTYNILKNPEENRYYVAYKQYKSGTKEIKNYLKENVYKSENENSNNPYVNIINKFSFRNGTPGAGLRIKAADLAYLKELGVYPINRMIILRRFPEGCFVPEDLNEMQIEPISTVIGWIKPDESFGKIDFNETWSTTDKRFDQLLADILKENTGDRINLPLVPIPNFTQGLLFEFYRRVGLTSNTVEAGVDEKYEFYDPKLNSEVVDSEGNQIPPDDKFNQKKDSQTNDNSNWGLKNIPIGDPNVLQEGPYRNPLGQNIKSSLQFSFDTIYEQKLIGDVDPGSAMLDILDNLYAMGTSNMVFYWGDGSTIIQDAKAASTGNANSLNSWWEFIKKLMERFWEELKRLFLNIANELSGVTSSISNTITNSASTATDLGAPLRKFAEDILESILTSTIAIHRFHIRGSIELMVGGKDSSTPWYLTIGNPFSPWLATNHIVVDSASIETSSEMGFNDQPQWLKVTFNVRFSRSLGKQELMRMFNNTFRRTYSNPSQIQELFNQKQQYLKNITTNQSSNETIADQSKSQEGVNFGGVDTYQEPTVNLT